MKKLELKWIMQPRRGERLDFVVSNRSLYKEFVGRGLDVVPRTGSNSVPLDLELRDLLLLEKAGDTPLGRVALYICPVCGDPGCGVVSVKITRDDVSFTWNDFGWEPDYIDEEQAFRPYEKLGPFRFDAQEYRHALLGPSGSATGIDVANQ
ncbi:MAG: hypothetical protein ACR2PA_13685 [Hyphomicrobiaceae bacterium]